MQVLAYTLCFCPVLFEFPFRPPLFSFCGSDDSPTVSPIVCPFCLSSNPPFRGLFVVRRATRVPHREVATIKALLPRQSKHSPLLRTFCFRARSFFFPGSPNIFPILEQGIGIVSFLAFPLPSLPTLLPCFSGPIFSQWLPHDSFFLISRLHHEIDPLPLRSCLSNFCALRPP